MNYGVCTLYSQFLTRNNCARKKRVRVTLKMIHDMAVSLPTDEWRMTRNILSLTPAIPFSGKETYFLDEMVSNCMLRAYEDDQ